MGALLGGDKLSIRRLILDLKMVSWSTKTTIQPNCMGVTFQQC